MRGRKKPWAQDFIAAHEELKFNKDEKLDKPYKFMRGGKEI